MFSNVDARFSADTLYIPMESKFIEVVEHLI